MARSIPIYQRQIIPQGIQGGPSARGTVSPRSPIGEALESVGREVQRFGLEEVREQKKKLESESAITTANTLSNGEIAWHEDFKKRTQEWKVGDKPLREKLESDFNTWMSSSAEKLQTESSKKYFQQHAIQMRTRLLNAAFDYQEQAKSQKLEADSVVAKQADLDIVFLQPERAQEIYARYAETLIARQDKTEAEKITEATKRKQEVYLGAEEGFRSRNNAEYFKQRWKPLKQGEPVPAHTLTIGLTDDLWSAQIGQESGGKQFDESGKPLTSKAGAIGRAQVMPSTGPEAAKLAGLKWDERRFHQDAGYNEALGRAYMAKQVEDFKDIRKALAAYNAGPERVRNLVSKYGDSWLDHAPKETREYVASITKKVPITQTIAGAASIVGPDGVQYVERSQDELPATFKSLPYQQRQKLMDASLRGVKAEEQKAVAQNGIEAAEAAVAAQDIGSDRLVDLGRAKNDAVSLAEQKMGRTLDATQRQQVEQSVERAAAFKERERKREHENNAVSLFDALDANGGDYQAIVGSNSTVIQSLPRDVQERVQKYAGEVATGATRATDWQSYSALLNDQKLLSTTNLDSMRDKFNAREFKELKVMQRKLVEKDGQDQTIQSDLTVVKALLKDAGVKSNEKEAKFFSLLQQSITQELEVSGKKKLRQEEVKKLASDLLVKEITSRGILWDSTERAFNIEVPVAERAKIELALRDQGLPATDLNILRVYRNKLQRAKAPKSTGGATGNF